MKVDFGIILCHALSFLLKKGICIFTLNMFSISKKIMIRLRKIELEKSFKLYLNKSKYYEASRTTVTF